MRVNKIRREDREVSIVNVKKYFIKNVSQFEREREKNPAIQRPFGELDY